jgi:hypothetical protein
MPARFSAQIDMRAERTSHLMKMTFFRSANGAGPYQPWARAQGNDKRTKLGLKARVISGNVIELPHNDGAGLQLAHLPVHRFSPFAGSHLSRAPPPRSRTPPPRPYSLCLSNFWGVAPGWYGAGPLALKTPPPPCSTDPQGFRVIFSLSRSNGPNLRGSRNRG